MSGVFKKRAKKVSKTQETMAAADSKEVINNKADQARFEWQTPGIRGSIWLNANSSYAHLLTSIIDILILYNPKWSKDHVFEIQFGENGQVIKNLERSMEEWDASDADCNLLIHNVTLTPPTTSDTVATAIHSNLE
jgi:hypothetical protein